MLYPTTVRCRRWSGGARKQVMLAILQTCGKEYREMLANLANRRGGGSAMNNGDVEPAVRSHQM